MLDENNPTAPTIGHLLGQWTQKGNKVTIKLYYKILFQIISPNQTVNFTVEYYRDIYEANQYVVNLEVKKNYFESLWWTIATAFTAFNLTGMFVSVVMSLLLFKLNDRIYTKCSFAKI